MNTRILFVSYDGLLDPLGPSQILPYVTCFRHWHEHVLILTFEKRDRMGSEEGRALRIALDEIGITWKALRFTRAGGLLGKLRDLILMHWWCTWLAWKHRVAIIHGRGHPATQAGLVAKRLTGARLVFDCRGLWADERVDKGGWDLGRRVDRLQYRYYKRVERRLFERSDHVVVLTSAVVPEILRLTSMPEANVTVIPCCADFEHFSLATAERRRASRSSLGLPESSTVLGYLGSIGRMYMLDAYLRLLRHAFEAGADVRGLVVTRDVSAFRKVLLEALPMQWHQRVIIASATRDEVPGLLHAMDVSVSFILPSYARMAASPTKLAESFAAGIPVICNEGVGDTREQVLGVHGGKIVDPTSDQALRCCARELEQVKALGGTSLRNSAAQLLGLPVAVQRYASVHARALSQAPASAAKFPQSK